MTLKFPSGPYAFTGGKSAIARGVLGCMTILATASAPAAAATYYVSTAGSDANSCAAAQNMGASKQTIAAGVTCLSAGDTLYIRGGTYTGSSNIVDSETVTVPSGISWAGAITIAGYPGETVTLRPPDGRQAIRLTRGSPHYIIFQDLILDGINGTSIEPGAPDLVYLSTGAHHNRFQRLEVKRSSANGFLLSANGGEANYNEILECEIHDNGRLDAGNSGYGIYLATSHNLIERNDIHSNNGYGVHQNALASHGNDNVIRSNRIHDNVVHGTIGVGGSTSYGVVLVNGNNNLIVNNLIYRNQGGILVYNLTTNAQIYNNTITENRNNAIDLQYYGFNPVIMNNIVYINGGTIVNHGGGSGTPVVDHNLTSNPAFVDAAGLDFRLTASSAAKDQGVDLPMVTRDYDGVLRQAGAYDIGAYEYVSTSTPPAVPPAAPRNVRILAH